MAYQTGAANDLYDIFAALKVFAPAVGWVVEDEQTPGVPGHRLVLRKGSYHCILWWHATSGISMGMRGVMAYDSGKTEAAQDGVSQVCYSNFLQGPYVGYEFYGDANYIHIVIEVQPNAFSFSFFGLVEKQGNYVGGEYYCNTYLQSTNGKVTYASSLPFNAELRTFPGSSNPDPGGSMRCVLDNEDDWSQYTNYDYVPQVVGGIGSKAIVTALMDATPNTFNGVSPLFPVYMFRNRTGGKSIVGHAPDCRVIRIDGFLPKQELLINPDTWRIYPTTLLDGQYYLAHHAFALRKF